MSLGGSSPTSELSSLSSLGSNAVYTPEVLSVTSPMTLTPPEIIKAILNIDEGDEDNLTIKDMEGAGHGHVYYVAIDDYERIFKIAHKTEEGVELIDREVSIYRKIGDFPEGEQRYFIQGVSGRLSYEKNDQYSYPGYAILSMPFIKGVDFQKFIVKQPKPSVEEIYRILKGTAEALLILLKHGISHADIHYGNIFVLASGEINLFDFDSAGDPLHGIGNPVTDAVDITRLEYNIIGVSTPRYTRGFIPMCKHVFSLFGLGTAELDAIEPKPLRLRGNKKNTVNLRENLSIDHGIKIYEELIALFKRKLSLGGRRTRRLRKAKKTRRK
jgi:serine/threonine protein kinase